MPDGFGVVFHGIRELEAEMLRIDRSVDRATMWTVREAGRRVNRIARRTAPVYKGADANTLLRKGQQGPRGNPNRPVAGLYKASIHSRKRLKRTGPHEYENAVAPRGPRVRLYAGKIEAKYGVMANAKHAVDGEMYAIAERAWRRATRGKH